MATTIPQENTAAIAANTAAISDLAAALAAEIENRRQIVDRAGAAAVEAVGATLRSGFTPWEFSGYSEGVAISEIVYDGGNWWRLELDYGGSHYSPDVEGGPDATELYFRGQYKEPEDTIRAVRHLITPTKTSQLTNDGDGTNAFVKTNDSRLSDARTPTAHSHAMSDVAGLGAALAQKASLSDLPYAMVTPGEWEFSDGEDHAIEGPIYDGEIYYYYILVDVVGASQLFNTESDALAALSLTFDSDPEITATRASLPGHLLDRAVNAVAVSSDTTLTLPSANPGHARDLIVRLTISGSTVPTITFAAPTGESIAYETDGDEFPAPDEAGTWLYSFTEIAAGVFAVALKKVNAVTQGGS